MKKILNNLMVWLAAPKNRIIATVITVVLLAWVLTGCVAIAKHSDDPEVNAQEAQKYSVRYLDQVMYLRTESDQHFVCMLTGEGFGFTNVPGWIGFTCNNMNTPLEWQFCAGKKGEPIFMCAPPGTRIQGAEAEVFEADAHMALRKEPIL